MMGFENLASLAPWKWLSNGSSSSLNKSPSASHHKHHRHLTKKHTRTRSTSGANGSAKPVSDSKGYYPGLVNISGTYCFMNSTLQALASLSYLQPHIDSIYEKAEILDVPTPVIDNLKSLLKRLNTPHSSYHAIRPIEIIEALTNVEGRTNALFYSREHQDAQELFQLLSECIKNEITAVDKEGKRDRGLGGFSQNSETAKEIGKSVFDGLTANRRSCVTCEYTEAVMHFSLDNVQLSLPSRRATSCRLEDCLKEYTRLELLNDCVCRKCSLVATHRRLQQELTTLQEAIKQENNPSLSKQRRFKDVRRMEARVRSALEGGRVEEDLKNVRLERVVSPATKQAMLARPPPVLALHVNRSIHYGQYATKNTTPLIFPEILDITPYTTSGNLSTKPTSSISAPPHAPAPSFSASPYSSYSSHASYPPRPTTPTQATYTSNPPTLYRLSAVVCHYGQHSFGHYVCYRRKPRSSSLPKQQRWAPPKLVDPLLLHELADREHHGSVHRSTRARWNSDSDPDDRDDELPSEYDHPRFVWDGEDPDEWGPGTGKGWLRISDDAVRECGIETVLAEKSGVFMLYYERVVMGRVGVYPFKVGKGEKGKEKERERERDKEPEEREWETRSMNGNAEYEEDYATYAAYAAGEGGIYSQGDSGTESEETLRPKTKTIVMNGSVDTLVSEVGVGVVTPKSKKPLSPSGYAVSSRYSTASGPGIAGIGSGYGKNGRMQLSVGPRVIRSVEAGSRRSGPAYSNASSPSSSLVISSSGSASTPALGSTRERRDSSSDLTDSTVTPTTPRPGNSTTPSKAKSPKTTRLTPPKSGSAGDEDWEHVQSHQRRQHHLNGDAVAYAHASAFSSALHSHPHHHLKSQSHSSTSSLPIQNSQLTQSASPSTSPSKHKPNTLKRRPKQSGSGSGKKSAS